MHTCPQGPGHLLHFLGSPRTSAEPLPQALAPPCVLLFLQGSVALSSLSSLSSPGSVPIFLGWRPRPRELRDLLKGSLSFLVLQPGWNQGPNDPQAQTLKEKRKKNKAEIKSLDAHSDCIMVVGQWLIFFFFFSTMKYSYPHSMAVCALVRRALALASSSPGLKSWLGHFLAGDPEQAICPFVASAFSSVQWGQTPPTPAERITPGAQ